MRKFLIALALLCSGCALPPRPPPPAAPAAPIVEPVGPFEAYEIVSSRVEVRVHRDGPMAQLGHNHLIVTDALAGTVQRREPRSDTRFVLELPLASLIVDDPAARAAAGPEFVNEVPQADREATQHNLLGPALFDAARQPVMRLTAESLEGGPVDWLAQVRVSLRGEERTIGVPLSVQIDGEELHVHASFKLHHADLGLVPFSVALGALRVRDEFDVDCRLVAKRDGPA